MTKLRDMGEHEAIRRLSAMLGTHSDLIMGPGDDCSVVRLPGSSQDQVFTTDPVIEDVHFLSSDAPERIGNKAAGRVLSDIAAMGAQPQWLLVDVVAPPSLDYRTMERIYIGMNALCERFDTFIIGGDLAQGPCLELHVFGTGTLPSGSALLRSGAKYGDAILVTGALGGSIHGKHLDFIPRVDEGIFLRDSGLVDSMIDISDGLATDLRHIMAQSGVGAIVDVEKIPITGTLDQALYDGEDFELLFTLPPSHLDELCALWKRRFPSNLSIIGAITNHVGMLQLGFADGRILPLERKAFEHFSIHGDID